jgi:hypothetical protein
MGLKPHTAELRVASLEARETVFVAFVKAVVASSPRKTGIAEPLLLRDSVQRRIEAEHMKACGKRK